MLKLRSTKLMCLLIAFIWTTVIIGSSYAYFIDSVQVTGNVIAAGNLKAGLEYKDKDGVWQPADNVAIFDYPYWEPNYTDVQYIRVSNKGNLAFQYRLNVVPAGILQGRANLMDVIDVYYGEVDENTVITKDNYKSLNKLGTLSDLMYKQDAMFGILLPNSTTTKVSLPDSAKNIADTGSVEAYIVLHMQEDAGNEYQGLSAGNGFNLQLSATQYMYEEDSFGNSYDEKSEYPELIPPTILSVAVQPDANGRVPRDVAFNNPEVGVSAIVPAGAKMAPGATKLTLVVEEKKNSDADVTLSQKDKLTAYNVKVEGLAADNTVPVIINMGKAMSEGMNLGNYDLYHVENGVTIQMTLVGSAAELDAHNEFFYNPATGEVIVAMANFSEVAVVENTVNPWNGNVEEFAGGTGTEADPYIIANADQLAYLGKVVGGMGADRDNFEGEYVKLTSDVNLGYGVEKHSYTTFHPIGYYYTDDKNDDGTIGDYYSTVYEFKGIFDGNGHAISNFYQNTWEIKGDYDGNYYDVAMGLFGYVVNGTVKNLTVDNFSSDGEFTPTGVIAAYAVNSTFENIAITNCNPRVYNTGNGGIVGIGGNSDDPDTYKLTFNNITIDNTNKITALWGSWDVACGGLVGMFRGAGHVYMNNCHVAAQMDVYNDVCGNYQYYWYRYSGMMVGTNKNMTTDANGYTVPETDKFHAENCTVHFGEWNDYYYCELVANSLASYTHDHQFSRLTEISSLDEIKSGDTWTKAGNFLLISGDTKTCYHIVKNSDGTLKQHLHTYAGYEDSIDEDGDGNVDLKEDKQIVYLPFNQLFTGYGWGVKHIPVYNGEGYAFKGITILDREIADSKVKFEGKVTELANNKEYKLGDIFSVVDNGVKLVPSALTVTVTNLDENNPVSATIDYDRENWENGTLTLDGTGKVKITIQDYYFCTPTTITVTVTEREAAEKFETKFTGDFLYRVGNHKDTPVKLDSLFKAKAGATIGTVSVTVEALNDTGASGAYTSNATWTNGTIQFKDTGVVKVTITDNDYCIPTVLYLEVVDAVNATTATSATANNVVLLNDITSGFTVSGRYAVYGNGFTLNYTGNGQYLNNGLKQGVVTVSENGTLDNLRIKASIYPAAYLYYGKTQLGDYVQGGPSSVEDDRTRYHYQLSAVAASGNATISNCYIYGGRNNIFVNTGDVTIKDTILECGTVANVQIQSNSSHTVTFKDVTTIQYQVNPTIDDTSKVMLGAGVLVGPDTTSNPTIVLNGDFKQYNWVTQGDANAVSDTKVTKAIIEGAVNATAYNHTVNGKTASNLGIIYMNEAGVSLENNTDLPYKLGNVAIKVSGNTANGQVYSVKNATAEQIYSDYANADKTTENGLYQPQFKYSADLGGQLVEEGGDEHCYREGDTIHVMFPSGDTKELDLAALVNIAKYTGQDLKLKVTCNGVESNTITLSEAGQYTVTYTVTDTLFYDKDGNKVGSSESYSWDVTVSVFLKDTAIPDARFEFDATKQKMGYYKPPIGDVKQYLPFLAGLKIYDYNGKTEYLRFDGSSDFDKVASITITGYASNKASVEVKLTDGGVINTQFLARANSGGGSTYTGKIKTSNNTIYFVNDGGTSNKESTTTAAYWYVDYYKFTGNNGVAIQSAQQTFKSTGSSASTPTGNFSTTIKYTVTYDANGGNCGQTTGYATSASAAVTLPTPTRSGYMFVGWFTAASGGTRVGGAGDSYTPSANITLYAQWGKPCTVTYDANGGSCGTASEKYTGTALTLPTPTRDGYWFTGWYDAANGGTKIGGAGASYQATGDITLYAQWSPVYTVTYNANGGSVTPASAKYEGTALTLPLPTRDGYAFNGWYTAASSGTKIGDAGASYTPTANITLYAQWKDPVKVTYDAITNGGSCSTTSQTYLGTALTLPTPAARTGYTFTGWYTAVSGGTRIGDAGESYTPSANTTLYAQWQINSYTIKVTTSNATVKVNGTTVNNNGTVSIQYGAQVTVEVTYSKEDNRSTTIKGADGTTYTSPFVMPAQTVTINASSSECVTPDTLITLADGTQVRVDSLTGSEKLLVWNMEIGALDEAPIMFLDSESEAEYEVVHLYFSDGTDVKVIYEHGFWDYDLNKYVYLDRYAEKYIDHTFAKHSGSELSKVKLTDVVIEKEVTTAWSPVTADHLCYFVNGMLSMPGGVGGLFNIFDVDPVTMTYDMEALARDIETYGLFTYEELNAIVELPEEMFNAAGGAYLKVSIGKGNLTMDELIYMIERYTKYFK